MKNNLLLAGLLTLSSSSLFSAAEALSPKAQDLINEAHKIKITCNGKEVILTLGETSQTITGTTNGAFITKFGTIIVGIGHKNSIIFSTPDKDKTLFPGFERMGVEEYALILQKTL